MHRKGFTRLASRSKFRKYVHFNEATCTGKALLVSPQGQSSEICPMRQHAQERLFWSRFKVKVRILACCILAKCELKKQLARWYFLYLHFLASGNLGLLCVVLILDIIILPSNFLKCRSLTVNVFLFIHRKTLSLA